MMEAAIGFALSDDADAFAPSRSAIFPFTADGYAQLIRGGQERYSISPYQYDPLTLHDRAALTELTTMLDDCEKDEKPAIYASIVEMLNPYLEKREASLRPRDMGERCEIPPFALAIRIYATDGTYTVNAGPYDLLVRWANQCGYRVLCEHLFNGDTIVHDGDGYTLLDCSGQQLGTYDRLDDARLAHAAVNPI